MEIFRIYDFKGDLLLEGEYGSLKEAAECNRGKLAGADFSGQDFSGIDLSKANLIFSRLVSTNLRQANLAGAGFASANLSGACLAEARLANADLVNTNLTLADLSGADFTGVCVRRTLLIGAKIDDAAFATLPDVFRETVERKNGRIVKQVRQNDRGTEWRYDPSSGISSGPRSQPSSKKPGKTKKDTGSNPTP